MSKISFLRVNNFLGIDQLELEPKKINIIRGPKGTGKTSVIEALEKSFLNKDRRTEVVKHGEEEATIFVECTDGLEIDRRIRTEKSNYLKVRNPKTQEGVPSTEKFLRDLVNGNIFRPLDWINMSVKEQTDSLLSMLQIGWDQDDITNWFGDLPSNIDYTQHILLILKLIEQKYYKDREEVNREIKELKARIKSIQDDLPPEYDGEAWRDKDVQSYYSKVKEAQDINNLIVKAKSLQENFDKTVELHKVNGEAEKSRITLKYKSEAEDINDILDLAKSKIGKATEFIDSSNEKLEVELDKLDNQLENEYQELLQRYAVLKDRKKKEMLTAIDEQKDIINLNENKISSKQQELLSLSEKEELEKKAVEERVVAAIEKEELRIGNASKYLNEHEEIDIKSLQEEANNVQEMVSYLRDWDRIIDIRDGKLAEKERMSADLTARIEKARTMPSELLRTAKMPVPGISVDIEGRVRINGTLIDGLSDGEKLELAMKVAKAQCGELKVICIDKFESLDSESQKALIEEMEHDDYQYIVTEVTDGSNGKVEIEKIGEVI